MVCFCTEMLTNRGCVVFFFVFFFLVVCCYCCFLWGFLFLFFSNQKVLIFEYFSMKILWEK